VNQYSTPAEVIFKLADQDEG